MSAPLLIVLPDLVSEPWFWRDGDRHGEAQSPEDKLGLGHLGHKSVFAIISGQAVRMLPHELPPMKDSERLSAASFALESQISAPLNSQHITLDKGDTGRAAVIDKEKFGTILHALSEAGITPEGIYADFDVLPQGGPVVLSDRVIYPGDFGYSLDRSWADTDADETRHARLWDTAHFENAINLRSGEFAKRTPLPIKAGSLARLAALLALACVTWLALQTAQTRAITAQTAAIKTDTSALYVQATGRTAPANPALAVTRAMKNGGSSGQTEFLALSDILFTALKSVDGIMVETLQFDSAKDQLSLRLIYPQFESAGALESAVQQSGGLLQPGGVREQSGRLIGDAILKAAP